MQGEINNPAYWDAVAEEYHTQIWISCRDFHLGPLLPGNRELQLLPAGLAGLDCLEVGCGAGQNSIFLASEGATCVALDAAARQLEQGQRLAAGANVPVDFRQLAMEDLAKADLGQFDLVHSVLALGFAKDPAQVIKAMALHMRPEATLLLSVLHPLFHHEWLELDADEWGLFVSDYFSPPEDRQEIPEGPTAVARAYPISTVVGWLADAELVVTRLVEPRAVPSSVLPPDAPTPRVPYDGPPWRALHDKLRKIPVAAVYVARRAP